MTKVHFRHEKEYLKQGYDFVIGVDEAGRGPLAGPVVACACSYKCHAEIACLSGRQVSASQKKKKKILKRVQDDKSLKLICDSKLLSEKQREELYDFIIENFHVGIGICDHRTIDRINILQATYLAMKKAITALKATKGLSPQLGTKSLEKCVVLVDGNKIIPNLSMEQKAIVGGDKIVKSISAASIIAKVTRDRIMREYHKKYPAYDFAKHKGYGTKIHRDMIKKHGFCGIHRKSFKVK